MQKSRRRILLFLLSGTVLAVNMFGGSKEARDTTLAPPADTAPAGASFDYPFRAELPASFLSSCTRTGYSAGQVPLASKELWDNMRLLRESDTVIGPALEKFSVRADIFYCLYNREGKTGSWYGDEGIALISTQDWLPPENQKADRLLSQIHETIHGLQQSRKVLDNDMSWPISEFQIKTMSYEAAAHAGEQLAAFELRRQSNTMAVIRSRGEKQTKEALDAYLVTLRKGTYLQALGAAGQEAFYQFFQEQHTLDHYNNNVLRLFISRCTHDKLAAPSTNIYSLDRARETGWISPAFNLTAALDRLPAYAERFGTNARMRQAFDYAELERIAATLGRAHPLYTQNLEKLTQEKNPYLGIKLADVDVRLSSGKTVVEIMDSLAAKEPAPRAAGTKTKIAPG